METGEQRPSRPTEVQIPQDNVRKWINSSQRGWHSECVLVVGQSPHKWKTDIIGRCNIVSAKGSAKEYGRQANSSSVGQSPPFLQSNRFQKEPHSFLQTPVHKWPINKVFWMAIRKVERVIRPKKEKKALERKFCLPVQTKTTTN